MLVFVYGPMMINLEDSAILDNSEYIGDGTVKGNLHVIEHFPVMVKGKGSVPGEVYDVDNQTLKKIDKIEEHYPKTPHKSLFTRELVKVTLEDEFDGKKVVDAFAYFFIDSKAAIRYGEPIENGYRHFLQHGNVKKEDLDKKFKVFVYGSLMKGFGNHRRMGDSKFIGYGKIDAIMYDLGYFPGIVHGKGTAFGELYEVDYRTLMDLDHLEGYHANKPNHSLYLREEVTVTLLTSHEQEKAFVYFYQDESRIERVGTLIENGDYRKYEQETPKKKSTWEDWLEKGNQTSPKEPKELPKQWGDTWNDDDGFDDKWYRDDIWNLK